MRPAPVGEPHAEPSSARSLRFAGPFTVLSAVVLLALWVAPAAAHVALMPDEVEPDGRIETRLVLAHGCGPEGEMPGSDEEMLATTMVTLEVPAGLEPRVVEVDGWSVSTDEGDERTVVRWEYLDPAGAHGTVFLDLELRAVAVAAGTELWLPVIQHCVGGERMAWTHPGMPERAPELPAARLLVAEPAAVESGLAPWTIAALAIGVGVLAGAGVFLLSGRRG